VEKRLERQVGYWKEHLAGVPVLELPTDRARPATQSTAGALFEIDIDAELTEGLRALARRQGSTLFMVLMGAFSTVLSRYSGQTDFAIGTPLAHRWRVEIESLIGFFVNTIPVRIDLSGSPSVKELLGRIRETTLTAHANQDVPFERMVQELRLVRDVS